MLLGGPAVAPHATHEGITLEVKILQDPTHYTAGIPYLLVDGTVYRLFSLKIGSIPAIKADSCLAASGNFPNSYQYARAFRIKATDLKMKGQSGWKTEET